MQTMEPIRTAIDKLLARNGSVRLQAIYTYTRKINSVSMIGDFPLISEIVHHCAKSELFFSASELLKVCKKSNDPFLHKQNRSSKLIVVLTDREKLKASIRSQKLKKAQSH